MPFVCVTFLKKKEKKKQLSNIFWKVKDIQVFDIHVKSRDVFRKIHFYIVLIILKKKITRRQLFGNSNKLNMLTLKIYVT